MARIYKSSKTKKNNQKNNKPRQNQSKHNSHRGGATQSTRQSDKGDVCNKNIDSLLIGEFRTSPNILGSDPKNLAKDLKGEANKVKNVASGNWLSMPGAPPSFPTCSIM